MKNLWKLFALSLYILALWGLLGSCQDGGGNPDGQGRESADASADVAADASPGDGQKEGAADAAVKPLPKSWETGLPTLDVGEKSRYRFVRAIVHLHSVYSHDACDGEPHVDGKKNLPCLQRLRDALCQDAIDVAFLTEHKSLMAEGDPIKEMVLHLDGDEYLMEGGAVIGNRFSCKSGHQVTVFPGSENALMPVGLKRHPTVIAGKDLSGTYGDDTSAAIDAFKAAGASVLIAHTEEKSLDYLRQRALLGIEIFNLHAALDPRKRGPDLGLNAEEAIGAFYAYIRNPADFPHPDLAFLGFHKRIPAYLDKWDALLAERMWYGFGGTDAHENVLRTPLADGQRPDSYARMMRWFSNHLMVSERSAKAYREALSGGRSLLVFEVLGTPDAFDFFAEKADGTRVEMGATTQASVKRIKVVAHHPYLRSEAPVHSKIKLVQITSSGGKVTSKVVAEGDDEIELKDPPAGTYRVEVEITPHHLKPLLTPETQSYLQQYPWIYSNPIKIEAAP